jgi:hypothetical protein
VHLFASSVLKCVSYFLGITSISGKNLKLLLSLGYTLYLDKEPLIDVD